MLSLVRGADRQENEIRLTFARSARLALLGLLAPPALLALASAAGYPMRAAAGPAFWLGVLAGFGGAGWFAASALGAGRPQARALAAVFLAAGLLVAPAVRALQGLTGHESLLTVAAATASAFAAAFALAGGLAAKVLGVGRLAAHDLATCAAGGLLGAAFAVLPFCWAWLRLDAPGGQYLVMTFAVVGFLGGLIAPFHVTGLALDRARDRRDLARS
jgi:hypothetical protein